MHDPHNDSGQETEPPLCELKYDEFAVIKRTLTFVDKTRFIKAFFDNAHEVVMLIAPRASGKTTLMDMLKQFLLGNCYLFSNLNIKTEEDFFRQHCKPHPVIHIKFGKLHSGHSFKRSLKRIINLAFQEHSYLLEWCLLDGKWLWVSDKLKNAEKLDIATFEKYFNINRKHKLTESDYIVSLQFLSEVLYTHYEEKVFILIDEYDAPALDTVLYGRSNKDHIDAMAELLKQFMNSTLKSNIYRGRVLITARSGLGGSYSGEATSIIQHYPFLSTSSFTPYLGFTAQEVNQLLDRPEIKDICGDPGAIRKWYDGCIVTGDSPTRIYSMWSVLNHFDRFSTNTIHRHEFDNITQIHHSLLNHLNTGKGKFTKILNHEEYVKNIQTLFTEPAIRDKLEQVILEDGEIKIRKVKYDDITFEHVRWLLNMIMLKFEDLSEEMVDFFLQYLCDCGYFVMLNDDKNKIATEDRNEVLVPSDNPVLKIPTLEFRDHLKKMCYSEAFRIVDKYDFNPMNIEVYIKALISVLEITNEKAFVDIAKAVVVLFSTANKMPSNKTELEKIFFTLAYDSRCFVPSSELQIKRNKEELGKIVTMKKNGVTFEYLMDSDAAKDVFKTDHHTKFKGPDYEIIGKKIYACIGFNIMEKKVSIKYKVGDEGEVKSVSSDI